MLNFEAFHETISSGANLLFLKNESFEDNQKREKFKIVGLEVIT